MGHLQWPAVALSSASQLERCKLHPTSWLAILSLAESSSFRLSSCCWSRFRCSSKDRRLISNSWLSFFREGKRQRSLMYMHRCETVIVMQGNLKNLIKSYILLLTRKMISAYNPWQLFFSVFPARYHKSSIWRRGMDLRSNRKSLLCWSDAISWVWAMAPQWTGGCATCDFNWKGQSHQTSHFFIILQTTALNPFWAIFLCNSSLQFSFCNLVLATTLEVEWIYGTQSLKYLKLVELNQRQQSVIEYFHGYLQSKQRLQFFH